MNDQADTLRKLMRGRDSSDLGQDFNERAVPVITFSSGKGGVGKSCLAANLATLLARNGLRILLVDGDMGLANLDILLGVQAGATLEQVLDGYARLQDAIIGVEPNLWLVPAATGLLEIRASNGAMLAKLSRLFEDCPWEMDAILLDIGAGIQPNVLSIHSPIFKSVIVVTPEPTSVTDSYALMKLLRRRAGIADFSIVVNQVTDGREGRQVFQKLKDVADRFMDVRMDYLGHWERDEKIPESVMKRKILLDLDKGAGSIPSLELLAKNVMSRHLEPQASEAQGGSGAMSSLSAGALGVASGNTTGFWKTLLGSAAMSSCR